MKVCLCADYCNLITLYIYTGRNIPLISDRPPMNTVFILTNQHCHFQIIYGYCVLEVFGVSHSVIITCCLIVSELS